MSYTGEFQVFEDIIKEIMIVYKHDNRPWLIGYSGGKDSTLLTCLVYEAMKRLKDAGDTLEKTVHIITSDTMVENPIVKRYMHSSSESINKAAAKHKLNIKAPTEVHVRLPTWCCGARQCLRCSPRWDS